MDLFRAGKVQTVDVDGGSHGRRRQSEQTRHKHRKQAIKDADGAIDPGTSIADKSQKI